MAIAPPETGGSPPSLPAITFAPRAVSSGSTGGGTRSVTVRRQKRAVARQQKAVRGNDREALIANDKSGFGLKRPYLGWASYPTSQETTPAQSTGSGSFVALLTVAAEPQHPKIRVRVRAVTGAATSGEVRLRDRVTGQVIGSVLVVGLATTVEDALEGALVAPTLFGAGAPMKVDIEARITAGASTIAVLVVYAVGVGT